jgi:hypothetical protein
MEVFNMNEEEQPRKKQKIENNDSQSIKHIYLEDFVNSQQKKTKCPGCFPIFQPNQLAHMDKGGCLYLEYD